MIGIIGAMKIEVERLRSMIKDPVTEKISGMDFVSGELRGRRVVTAQCGEGKVAAAICAQTMLLRFDPELIINTGVAGSLSEKLGVGDIAVADRLVQHDMDVTPLGKEPGYIFSLGEVYMPADAKASAKLLSCAESLGINCETGVIASGDQFIADPDKKARIVSVFGAIACEMEGAAIAQVCRSSGVPFAVIRAISDSADGSANVSFEEFTALAAENAAKIVESFLAG